LPRLPRIPATRLVRALQRAGFAIIRQRSGSHMVLRDGAGRTVIVAMHPGDVPTGTLAGTLRQAGLTPEQLRELL
jgi:predicted RNA binding protein YcfA (HicA-like mRNA interferase family)